MVMVVSISVAAAGCIMIVAVLVCSMIYRP